MGERLTYFDRASVNNILTDNVTGGIVEHMHVRDDGTVDLIVQHNDGTACITIAATPPILIDVDPTPAVIPEVQPTPTVIPETQSLKASIDRRRTPRGQDIASVYGAHNLVCDQATRILRDIDGRQVMVSCNCGYRVTL